MVGRLLDLRTRDSWEPSELLEATFRWPGSYPLVPLHDVVEMLRPDSNATTSTPVLSPGDVDRFTGDARRRSTRYSGPVYQVRQHGPGLRPGDLLLPSAAGAPAVLITEELVGASVAGTFTALRPVSVNALWLWAVLSSRTGLAARAARQSSGLVRAVPRARLLDLAIPVSPLIRQSSPELRSIAASVSLQPEENAQSWWHVTALPNSGEWSAHLATLHPEWLTDGTPLADLCADIVKGRAVSDAATTPVPGWSPLTDPGVLAGRPARRWISPTTKAVTAAPADVMVSGIGTTFTARVAEFTQVLGPEVYALRLLHHAHGPALAQYLNSGSAVSRRAVLMYGATIPRIGPAQLRRFPVPPETLMAPVAEPVPPRPLADRLEELLCL